MPQKSKMIKQKTITFLDIANIFLLYVMKFFRKARLCSILLIKNHGASGDWLKTQLFTKVDFQQTEVAKTLIFYGFVVFEPPDMKAKQRFCKVCKLCSFTQERLDLLQQITKFSKMLLFCHFFDHFDKNTPTVQYSKCDILVMNVNFRLVN